MQTLSRFNLNYATLEQKLRQGHRLRVLIVHPEGPGVEMAVSGNYIRKEVSVTSSRIRDNLQLLCDQPRGRMKIRTIQTPLFYGVIATNPYVATVLAGAADGL